MTPTIATQDALAALAVMPVPLLVLDGPGQRILLTNAPFLALLGLPAGPGGEQGFTPSEEALLGSPGGPLLTQWLGRLRQALETDLVGMVLEDVHGGQHRSQALQARWNRAGGLNLLTVQAADQVAALLSPLPADSTAEIQDRQSFRDSLVQCHALAIRYGRPLALLLAHVDCPGCGPQQDSALHKGLMRHVDVLLRGALRASDFSTRVGHAEFALILPETNEQGGRRLAHRLFCSVTEDVYSHLGAPVLATLNIGLALLGGNEQDRHLPLDGLLRMAGLALKEAMALGANRFCVRTLRDEASAGGEHNG